MIVGLTLAFRSRISGPPPPKSSLHVAVLSFPSQSGVSSLLSLGKTPLVALLSLPYVDNTANVPFHRITLSLPRSSINQPISFLRPPPGQLNLTIIFLMCSVSSSHIYLYGRLLTKVESPPSCFDKVFLSLLQPLPCCSERRFSFSLSRSDFAFSTVSTIAPYCFYGSLIDKKIKVPN